MQDVHILQELLAQPCSEIQKKRLTSLMVATSALLEGNALFLTTLGVASMVLRQLNIPSSGSTARQEILICTANE